MFATCTIGYLDREYKGEVIVGVHNQVAATGLHIFEDLVLRERDLRHVHGHVGSLLGEELFLLVLPMPMLGCETILVLGIVHLTRDVLALLRGDLDHFSQQLHYPLPPLSGAVQRVSPRPPRRLRQHDRAFRMYQLRNRDGRSYPRLVVDHIFVRRLLYGQRMLVLERRLHAHARTTEHAPDSPGKRIASQQLAYCVHLLLSAPQPAVEAQRLHGLLVLLLCLCHKPVMFVWRQRELDRHYHPLSALLSYSSCCATRRCPLRCC